MLSLGIRYLMGWAMAAADGAKKEVAEWPPHPDRVFQALAAAWFETGQDDAEGQALRWLEQLAPPSLSVSGHEPRQVVTHFVPVNDVVLSSNKQVVKVTTDPACSLTALKDAGLSQTPEFRSRQPRSFPVAIPHSPVLHLIWDVDVPPVLSEGLARLCDKAVSIGHSASLVQMWVEDAPYPVTLTPVAGSARHRLRVPGTGRLQHLESRCNRQAVIAHADLSAEMQRATGKAKKDLLARLQQEFPLGAPISQRPSPGLWQGYDVPRPQTVEETRGSLFDSHLVILALSGTRLTLETTLQLCEALRGSMLSACTAPIPEWLSGHQPDASPSRHPHMALLPMPFVDRDHADGRVLGLALAVPREIDPGEVDRCLSPWLRDDFGQPRRLRLFNGQWFSCELGLETRENPPHNLQAETWTRSSRRWATVTPIVLDRHFDGPAKWDRAAESIKDSCERIGLPRPMDVLLQTAPLFTGVPHCRDFPRLVRKKDGGLSHHMHALLLFEDDVVGPVLLGAGRYRGYGLCRPLQQGGNAHAGT
jgi:CRISPR-associated protein Csb2